jgi:hypothetical protein
MSILILTILLNFIYQSFEDMSSNVLQELGSKQRKIRSMRGFFLYTLEIIETDKDYEILQTNLQPFFWRKVKNIIRQNKKAAFQEFLFGSQKSIAIASQTETQNHLKTKIENLQTQLNFLQNRIAELENQTNHLKDADELRRKLRLREQNKAP